MPTPRRELGRMPLLRGRPAILAGLAGGVVFLLIQLILLPLVTGSSALLTVRMMGAMLLGPDALAPAAFGFGVFLAAMLVHFVLSVLYAMVFAAIIQRMSLGTALLSGALLGWGLYLVNFYGFTVVFPWFAALRHWVTNLTHIGFGLTVAYTYKALLGRSALSQTTAAEEQPPEQRRAA